MRTLDKLEALFASASMQAYLGEPVTLAQHMLQAAVLAEADGAPDVLVAAALLHDVGHILAQDGTPHELAAADWLAGQFPTDTRDAVRLHVQAKRYLCAVEPGYFDSLSDASRESLVVQGGPLSAAEVERFSRLPYAPAAIRLRRWDEAAKDPAAWTPPFEHFRPLLERLLT
jgi:gamma-butyrobetaine dioxygenase